MFTTSADTELYSVDIDLRRTIWAPSVQGLADASTAQLVRIRSLWLPAHVAGPLCGARTRRLRTFVEWCARRNATRMFVLPTPRDSAMRAVREAVQQAVPRASNPSPIVQNVDAEILSHAPRALEQLTTIRHMAEEWDTGIGLDLTGHIGATWEAEAAIMRLLPRLAIVRLPLMTTPSSIVRRSLAILADQGYGEAIVIGTRAQMWPAMPGPLPSPEAIDAMRLWIIDEFDRRGAIEPMPRARDTSRFEPQ